MTISWAKVLKIAFMKKRLLILIFLTMSLGMLGGILIPISVSKFIDSIQSVSISHWTIVICIIAMVAAVVSPIANLYSTYYIATLSGHVEKRIQNYIYMHMLKVESHRLPHSSGAMIAIFSNARNISSFVAGSLPSTFSNILMSISSFIVMMYYDYLIALMVTFLAMITSFILSRTQSNVVNAIQENYRNMSLRQEFISESTRNINLIKSQTMQRYMLLRWADVVRSNTESGASVMYYGGVANAISAGSTSFITVAVVIVGVIKIRLGGISYGDLVALSILAASATVPISMAAAMMRQLHEANVAIKELQTFFGQPREKAIAAPPKRILENAFIKIDGLSYRHDGKSDRALNGLKIDFPSNGLVAIVGKNGAGKSTLLSILLGEKRDYEGEISVGGVNLREYDPQFLRTQFGSVRQESVLLSGTLESNGNPPAN